MSDIVTAALLKKLGKIADLNLDDVKAIKSMPIIVKHVPDHHYVVRDRERPTQCCLVIEGFAVRSKTTRQGRRQILSIHIPGDIPDVQSLHLGVMDHDLITLTPATLGFIPHLAIREMHRLRPRVAEIFWRETLIDAAMFREWIVNVGQRQAPSRMAHLVLELKRRLEVIGPVISNTFQLPMTQDELGDALGLTAVHVNRTIKQLRDGGLMEFQRQTVKILNEPKLKELADFDELYLHQDPSL
ncbi:MAG: Crp/Fnr family transcriptional regulator [Oxalobacteraceae bacterium]|nr:MAG: Crp/Fnr family transcriptional regulator [Oxalobacteraceae bacterium]